MTRFVLKAEQRFDTEYAVEAETIQEARATLLRGGGLCNAQYPGVYLTIDGIDVDEINEDGTTSEWFCDHCGLYFPVKQGLTCICGAVVDWPSNDVAKMPDGHQWSPPGAKACETCAKATSAKERE